MKVLEHRGRKFINLTPHKLVFIDGKELEPFDEELVRELVAAPYEMDMGDDGLFVMTKFKGSQKGWEILERLNRQGYTVITSIINAQAYRGACVSPIPTPETARAPASEKRVQYKFNIYPECE